VCHAKEAGALWSLPSLAHVESFEVETCPPPLRALIPLQPDHFRFSYLQPSRGMDLNYCSSSRGFANSPIWDLQLQDSVCMYILFFISHPVILSLRTLLKWFIHIVLIVL
jgi:hypothetical protein